MNKNIILALNFILTHLLKKVKLQNICASEYSINLFSPISLLCFLNSKIWISPFSNENTFPELSAKNQFRIGVAARRCRFDPHWFRFEPPNEILRSNSIVRKQDRAKQQAQVILKLPCKKFLLQIFHVLQLENIFYTTGFFKTGTQHLI